MLVQGQFIEGQIIRLRDGLWRVESSGLVQETGGVEFVHCAPLDLAHADRSQTFLLPPDAAIPTEVELHWGIGQIREWHAYQTAWRLGIAHRNDALLSLARGRVAIDAYQLVPALKALQLPRARLLIADDVGLGKTIEAGLILAELIARGRANRILIVTPAGLQTQWRDEMDDKFGLSFEVLDAARLQRVRAGLPAHANPWGMIQHAITSIDYAKRERVRQTLGKVAWDVVIIDEAHTVAIGGTPDHPNRTLRHRLAQVLAGTTTHLLLLSATPHNGYEHSFRSLIELVDPYLAGPQGFMRAERLQRSMVRRLKADIRDAQGKPRFRGRRVEAAEVTLGAGEALLLEDVLRYATNTAKTSRMDENADLVAFAMAVIKKRLMSSRVALIRTLRARLEGVKQDPDALDAKEVAAQFDLPMTDGERERLERRLVASALPREKRRRQAEAKRLQGMIDLAESIPAEEDAKARALLAQIGRLFAEPDIDHVMVFTEYRDTMEYLANTLETHGYAGRVVRMHGGLTHKRRTEAMDEFADAGPRIIVATDAASEGLNFQDHCHVMIHNELPWNPNRLEQRNGRIDRWGQKYDARIYNLFVPQSPEDRVLERLKERLEGIRQGVGSVADVLGMAGELDITGTLVALDPDAPQAEQARAADDLISAFDSRVEAYQSGGVRLLFADGGAVRALGDVERAETLSASLLPDDDGVRRFMQVVLTGALMRPTPRPDIYALRVPPHLRAAGVEAEYSLATFKRSVAVERENRDVAFIGPHHALVATAIAQYRMRRWNPDWPHRMAYAVIEQAATEGILFPYVGTIRASGTRLEEHYLPVFVALDGAVSQSLGDDLRLVDAEPHAVEVPEDRLQRMFAAQWPTLRPLAEAEALRRLSARYEMIREERRRLALVMRGELVEWERARTNEIEQDTQRRAGMADQRGQLNLLDQIGMRRTQQQEREVARIIADVRKREGEIARFEGVDAVAVDDVNLLGALLVLPASGTREAGG